MAGYSAEGLGGGGSAGGAAKILFGISNLNWR